MHDRAVLCCVVLSMYDALSDVSTLHQSRNRATIRVFGMSLLPYPILSSSLLHPSMCSMQETSKPPVTPLTIDLWTLNLPPQKQDPDPKGIAGPREEQN